MKLKDRIKEFKRVPAHQLQPDPKNWRTHPQTQQDALRGVLAEIGIAGAVLARETPEGGLMLIDGHLRTDVMHDQEIPCLVLDVTEEEAAVLLATLDPLAAMAEADAGKLDALLRDVETSSEAVQQMLAELAEDSGLYLGEEPEITEDEVPEPPAEPITKPGDLWILGEHRLLCGDSTKAEDVERLMDGQRADAIVTDPPYGQNQQGVPGDEAENLSTVVTATRHLPIDNGVIVAFQSPRTFPAWLNECVDAGHRFERMLWLYKRAQNSYPWRGWLLKSEAIVVTAVGQGNWQDYHPYAHDCYMLSEVSGEIDDDIGWHGSVKPLTVVADIMHRVSPVKALILDPFLGSGTTLIAAEQLGRRCYGMEISPQYCDVIVKRWETLTGRKAERSTAG